MPKIECPECGEELALSQDDATLFNQIECPHCGVLLEIVDEEPLTVEAVDFLPSDDDEEEDLPEDLEDE